jgi:cation diffusion facilitator family transporter
VTKLLLRFFLKDSSQSETPQTRARVGRLSGIIGLICNLLLFAGKLVIGIVSGAVSITADAMNNLSDASSSIVTLIGFKLAEKPADADHPYGHARYEYLSGLAVAGLIIVIGFELTKTSVGKILHPEAVVFSIPLVIVLVLSITVKLWLFLFNRKLGHLIHSTTLLATAADSRNDVISTTAVLVSVGVEALSGLRADGYMGLAVALFILYSGAMLAKDTISPLLGEAASPQLRHDIIDEISAHPKVLGYHDLMVHDYGPGQRFASLHVEMDQLEDPMVCHDIIDDLERECLQKHNVHLVIHYDPIVTGDDELAHTRDLVQNHLAQVDSRLSIHDFRMVSGNGHTNLIFDVALPDDLSGQKKALKSGLENALLEQTGKRYYAVITFDPTQFNKDSKGL